MQNSDFNNIIEKHLNVCVEVESDLASLIPEFIKKRRQDLVAFKENISHSNFAEIKKLGHDMRGVPGAFGYYFLVDLGKEIETAARLQDINELQKLVFQFENLMKIHQIKIEGDDRIYHEQDFIS